MLCLCRMRGILLALRLRRCCCGLNRAWLLSGDSIVRVLAIVLALGRLLLLASGVSGILLL